jgi:hypothetical protein
LALHQYVVQEKAQGRVAPVAILSAESSIPPVALEHFKGRHVRIYPCRDKEGIAVAGTWQQQLKDAGAKKVDFFNFGAFQSSEGRAVKDLCEFNRLKLAGSDFNEGKILP